MLRKRRNRGAKVCHGWKAQTKKIASVSHAATSIARSISEGSWTFLVSGSRKRKKKNERQLSSNHGRRLEKPCMPKASRRWTRQAAHVLDHRLAGPFMPASVDRRDMRVRACVCARLWWWCVPCEGVWPMSRATTRESPDEANDCG